MGARRALRRRAKLRAFDRATKRTLAALETRYGADGAAELEPKAREEHARLPPDLPDLGGRQPFSQFVATTAWTLAFYGALGATEAAARQAGELAYALTSASVLVLPRVVRRGVCSVWFSSWFEKRVRSRAARSHLREGSRRAREGDLAVKPSLPRIDRAPR